MKNKKYQVTDISHTRFCADTKRIITLYRIQALSQWVVHADSDTPLVVKKGDFGGWVQHEGNLSQKGTAWITGDAQVSYEAHVGEHALVKDHAMVCGHAVVFGYATVQDNAKLFDTVRVHGRAVIKGRSALYNRLDVSGKKIVDSVNYSIKPNPRSNAPFMALLLEGIA